MTLTRRQLQVFNFVAAFLKEQERSPTLDEICQGVGLNQAIEASRYLNILVEKEFLFRLPGIKQQIRVVKYPDGADANKYVSIAYARGVAAGRAQMSGPGAPDAHALRQAYSRGFREGQKRARETMPKDASEAFERGIAFGRRELKEELTYAAKNAKLDAEEAPVSSPRLLPFLRRSD